MALQDEIRADVKDLLLQQADFAHVGGIKITPEGGSEITIDAQVAPAFDLATGTIVTSQRMLLISSADVPSPARGVGSIDGKRFRVIEIEEGGPGAWVLRIDVGGDVA